MQLCIYVVVMAGHAEKACIDADAGIWGMPVEARWELYHGWCREYHSALQAELTDLLKRHTELSARLAVSSCPTLQPFDVIRSTSLLC